MEPERPATGIMKLFDYPDWKVFRIECDCGEHSHAVDMSIEIRKELDFPNQIELEFSATTITPFWNKGFSRFKTALKVLVFGHAEYSHTIVLKKQVALNLAETIKHAINDLEHEQTAQTD